MPLRILTEFAVPGVALALDDLVGCMRRDDLIDRLAVAALAVIFNLVLLAGAAAPTATRSFTCRFFCSSLAQCDFVLCLPWKALLLYPWSWLSVSRH